MSGAFARFVVVVAAVACVASVASGCLPKDGDVPAGVAFSDDFARSELGDKYVKRGGTWRIVDGKLATLGEHNQPLWLDVPLARNVRVEFTTVSRSSAVDTKIEIFGDGVRHESGYIVILADNARH